MKNHRYLLICIACISLIFSCTNPLKHKLQGTWQSKEGDILKITENEFLMESDSPIAEDYTLKGDTILTSFEGNQPYTKFVVQKVDDHNLKLLYPDSMSVEFSR